MIRFLNTKIMLIIIFFIFLTFNISQAKKNMAIAQTSPSASISSPKLEEMSDKIKQIESLKEKIATKVAEIRKNEKSVTSGLIKKISDQEILLETAKGNLTVFTGDDTKIFNLETKAKNEIKKDDLTVGTEIAVFGYKSQEQNTFTAKYIYTYLAKIRLTGKVVNLDKDKFVITIKTKQGEFDINFEKTSKATVLTKIGSLQKSGFSKIKTQDIIHAYCLKDEKDNTYTADKLVHFTLADLYLQESNNLSTASATPKAN